MNASTFDSRHQILKEKQYNRFKQKRPSGLRTKLNRFSWLCWLSFVLLLTTVQYSAAQNCSGSISLLNPTVCSGTTEVEIIFNGNGLSTALYNIRLGGFTTGGLNIFNVAEVDTLTVDISNINSGVITPGTRNIGLILVEATNNSCGFNFGSIGGTTLTIVAAPEIAITNGNMQMGMADLLCVGEPSNVDVVATSGLNVDYIITGVTPMNVTGTLNVNDVLGNSMNDPVAIPAPTLNDANLSGQIVYEITPRTGTCMGDPVTTTITIEPQPVLDPLPPASTNLCASNLTGTADVTFTLQGPTDPSDNSLVSYRLESTSMITDPNSPSAGLTTTQLSASLPTDFDGTLGAINITNFTDNINVANPANLLQPVTITYQVTPLIQGDNGSVSCTGSTAAIEYVIQPNPDVNFEINRTMISASDTTLVESCSGEDIELTFTPTGANYPDNIMLRLVADAYDGDESTLLINNAPAPAVGGSLYFDPVALPSFQNFNMVLTGNECVTAHLTLHSFIDINDNGTYETGIDCIGTAYAIEARIINQPQLEITESDGLTPISNPLPVCEVSTMGSTQVAFTLTSPNIPCDSCILQYRLIGTPVINDPNIGTAYDSDGMGAAITNSQTIAINFSGLVPGATFSFDFTDDITIAQTHDFHEAATITYQFQPWMVCNGTPFCFGSVVDMVAEIIPAPKVRLLDGTNSTELATDGSEQRMVCNGDEEDLVLRVRTNFTEPVTYDIQSATITPAGALTNIWAQGSTVAAMPAGSNLEVLNPSLVTGFMSGQIDYTIVPRNIDHDCLGEPISFSIIVTEDPDVFTTGPLTETLCSGFAPSFELQTNFVDPSQVLYDVNIVTASDLSGSLTFDGSTAISGLPISLDVGLPGDQMLLLNSYFFAMIQHTFENNTAQQQMIELEVIPRLPLPDGPCAAAQPINLTILLEPIADDVFTSLTQNNPFIICSGESSDLTIDIDPLFVDAVLGSGYEVELTLTPMPITNANNPESANITLPAATTVTFNDDSPSNLSHNITDVFTNTTGDYALVEYLMTAVVTSATGTSCTMTVPQPPIPFRFRVAPEPVLTANDLTLCSNRSFNIEDLISDNTNFASTTTPSLVPTTVTWQVVGGPYPAGISEIGGLTNGTFDLTATLGAATPSTMLTLNSTNTVATTVDFEFTSTNQQGCTGTTTVTVTVDSNPVGTISLISQSICADVTSFDFDFTATSGTGPYTLVIGNDENADGMITNFPTFMGVNSGDVLSLNLADMESGGTVLSTPIDISLLSIRDANGCPLTNINQSVQLTISPTIDVSGILMSLNVCETTPRMLLARTGIEITGGITPYVYNWTLIGNGSLDTTDLERPIYDPNGTAAGSTVSIQLNITDANGVCTATKTTDLIIFENETPTDPGPINSCSSAPFFDLTTLNGTVSPAANTVNWFDGDPNNGGVLINPDNNVDLSNLSNGLWTQVVNGPCREAIPITVNFNDPDGTISIEPFLCAEEDEVIVTFSYTGSADAPAPYTIILRVSEDNGTTFTGFNFTNLLNGGTVTLLDGVHYNAATVAANGGTLLVRLARVTAADACETTGIAFDATTILEANPDVQVNGGTPNVEVTVCNGDLANLELTTTYTPSDEVQYLVVVSGGTNLNLGANPFDHNGGFEVAPAGGAPLAIPTPSLLGNAQFGTVTYTIFPRTLNGGCDGESITVTINVETDPDVFPTGFLTEQTLCSGGEPSFELQTNFADPSVVLYDVEIISAGPNVISTLGGGPAISAPTGILTTLNANQFLSVPSPSYYFTRIPDVLTLAPAANAPETIVYRVTPKKTTAACSGATPIDFTVNIVPMATNVLTVTNNANGFCSGGSSDILIEVDPFFVSDFGGNHEVQVTIKAVPVDNASNPISSQLTLPNPIMVVFNNDNVANLDHTISDLYNNTFGDYARIDYQLCAIVLNSDGTTMCEMVITEASNGDLLDVRVFPEPVLAIDPITICSGEDLNGQLVIGENPVSNPAAIAALTPISADWEVVGGYPMGLSGTAGGSGTTSDISTGLGVVETLTNTSNAPIPVFYQFTPTNARGCVGETAVASVTIDPAPVGTISLVNAEVCDAADFQIQFNSTSGTEPFTVRLAENSTGAYQNLPDFTMVNNGDILTIAQSDLGSGTPGTFTFRLNRLFDANTCDSEYIGSPLLTATINENPQIDILAASRRVCQEDTRPINISVSGGSGTTSYSWNPSNLFVDDMAAPPAIFDATGLAAGTYPITVTATDDNSGCSDTDMINVIVESTPNINIIVSSNTICEGEMLTLTFDDIDDTGMTFTLSGMITDDGGTVPFNLTAVADGASITVTEGVDFNGNVIISGIEAQAENPPLNCSTTLADISIDVISAPSIALTYNTPTANLGEICSGEMLDIVFNTDAPGTEGIDYVFIVDAIRYETPTSGDGNVAPPGGTIGYGPLTGGSLVNGMDNIVSTGMMETLTNTTGDPVRISYRVFTRLLGSGCEGNFQWINAVINSAPAIVFTAAGPFCLDDAAVNLTATPAGGTFSGNGITDMTLGTFDPATAGLGTHTITYSFTDPATLCQGTEEIMIVVGPEITFTAAGPFCIDAAAVNLSATPTGGTFSGNGITDMTLGTFDPATAGANTHTITYAYTDPGTGCSGTASIMIVVNALPVVNLTAAGPLCTNDDSITLNGTPANGTYTGTGITDANLGTFDPATAGMGNHIITYTFTDTNNCTNSANTTIVVNTAPTVSLAAAGPFCMEDAATNLNGTPTGGMYSGNGITDANLGIFDPSNAGVGTHTIRYFLTDANNCSDTTMTDIVVNSCLDPMITNNDPSIADPCVCIGNGQFSEEVLITSDPGETWTITSTTLIDPVTMLPFPMGYVIPETPAGSGRYLISGIHLDGIGYTLSAESAMQPLFPLMVSNTCYYPDPVIEALTGYCMDSDPVTIVGHAGGETGTGSFMLNATPLVTVETPAGSGNWQASFNPSFLITTTHTLTFTFDAGTVDQMNGDSVGCVAMTSQDFEISGDQGDLECTALVNVSVGADCMATIDPDDMLAGNNINNDLYLVEIFVNGVSIGNTIDGTYIGQTLEVRVTDLCSSANNFCWGNIFIEDAIPPVLDCQPVTIWCNEDPAPTNPIVGFPTINDTCDPNPDVSFTEVLTDYGCTQSALYSAKITRTWTVCDASNNCTSCDQEIFLRRATTADIDLPPNYDGLDQPAFSCSDPSLCLDPVLTCTGYPTMHGIPVDGGSGFCELNVASSDDTLFIDAGTYKILRTWTIINWCNSNDILQHIQIIKVEDTENPTITCPADFTTGTSSAACEAIVILPAAQVSDNCSAPNEITVQTFLGTQLINGNGGNVLLSLGTHSITYVATDDSGNSASCEVDVTVEDDVIPAAICTQSITVGLTLNEPTLVFANSFDDGSHDNCSTTLTKLVRRMDSPNCPGFDETAFDATIPLYCCDVGHTVMVAFQVTDEAGNSNTCMVEVTVQDKLSPALICPSNKTIDCEEEDLHTLDGVSDDASGSPAYFVTVNPGVNDTTFVGFYANVFDNCGATVYIKDEGIIDNCGLSVNVNGDPAPYFRIYVAVDPSGNVKSCTQQINVVNQTPFQLSNITFPADITLDGCMGANIDPSNTGRPIYDDLACALISDTLKDHTFTFVNGTCLTILRTWKVIDLCNFDATDSDLNSIPEPTDDGVVPGFFQDLQIIKVLDSEAPEITSACTNVSFDGGGLGCVGFANLQATANDCSPSAVLTWTYRIDADNDGSYETNGTGNDASGTYPVGTHRIEWTVSDGCGNGNSCDYTFTINDVVPPQATCINETVNLTAPDYESVLWTSDVILASGTFDHCGGDLTYSFDPNNIQTGITFNCDSVGVRQIKVYVTDVSGQQSYCTTMVTVQANGPNACLQAPMASISGTIMDEEGEEVEYVNVDAGYGSPSATTSDGVFYIDSLPMYNNYMVSPNRNDDPLNGITTYDVILMSLHILGMETLDSPYKIIAADINRSGSITAFDMVELRKLILFINTEFTENTSWRFVEENYVFPNPTNPFESTFPEEYVINGLENSMEDIDFVAIKTGDLNNSAIANGLQSGDTRTDNEVTLVLKEQVLEAGSVYTLPFYARDFKDLYGYQFTLGFEPTRLEFVDQKSGSLEQLNRDNFGLQFVNEGIITTSWSSNQLKTIDENEVLFSLQFKARQNGLLSSMLQLSPRYTPAEAYNALGERLGLALEFETESGTTMASFALFQNRPNPFKNETVIGFNLPESSSAQLSIYDVSGRLLKTIDREFSQGYQEVVIDRSELNASGVLYYQLDTPTHTATRKMTLINE